jgi:intracellular sulfur oxidation DsrE/DsrF family protein
MLYANNLYEANKKGYSLAESDIAIVICLRHFATAFAYNDAIWGKYGKQMSMMLEFTDPKTKQAPSTNLLNSADYGMALPNFGTTIDSVVKRGVQFAVCDMATHFFAGQIAMASGGNADALYNELVANRIPNSHMVPAGVVAVNRAQEYGYTLLTAL